MDGNGRMISGYWNDTGDNGIVPIIVDSDVREEMNSHMSGTTLD